MSHSDRKTEEAEIKHSLFGFCFCSMCRGLKRPEPGSKGENPKLPYDKKSYEEHFPLLGQGSQARVGQTNPGPACSLTIFELTVHVPYYKINIIRTIQTFGLHCCTIYFIIL